MSTDRFPVSMTVNGESRRGEVPARMLLSDFLRHELGLTGTHVGCEHGVCGACTVLVDGEAVRSCLLLAVQMDGHEIRTVEGLTPPPRQADADATEEGIAAADRAAGAGGPEAGAGGGPNGAGGEGGPVGVAGEPRLHPLQAAFREAHGLQCGFCTPGILMALVPFLEENLEPAEEEIRELLSGHLCRCTGYQFIVDAAKRAAERMAGGPGATASGKGADAADAGETS